MLQPADIAVEEGAQIVHAIFEHRQPIDAAAEREALPLIGIKPAGGDHLGVDMPEPNRKPLPLTGIRPAGGDPLGVDMPEPSPSIQPSLPPITRLPFSIV